MGVRYPRREGRLVLARDDGEREVISAGDVFFDG
jgi:hypothetical protein